MLSNINTKVYKYIFLKCCVCSLFRYLKLSVQPKMLLPPLMLRPLGLTSLYLFQFLHLGFVFNLDFLQVWLKLNDCLEFLFIGFCEEFRFGFWASPDDFEHLCFFVLSNYIYACWNVDVGGCNAVTVIVIATD